MLILFLVEKVLTREHYFGIKSELKYSITFSKVANFHQQFKLNTETFNQINILKFLTYMNKLFP